MSTLWILEGAPAHMQNGHAIPVHEVTDAGLPVETLTVGASTARVEIDGGVGDPTRIITLVADADVHVQFGGSSVDATTDDMLLPGGAFFSIAVRSTSSAALYVAAIDA